MARLIMSSGQSPSSGTFVFSFCRSCFVRRFGWRVTLFAVTIVSFVAARLTLKWFGTDASFSFLALFGFGMAGVHVTFSLCLETLGRGLNWPLWGVFAALVFVAGVEVPPLLGRELPLYQLDFLAGVCAVLLLVTMCQFPQSGVSRACSWPPLVRIGAFSYSLYLIHAPLIQVLWQLGISRIKNPQIGFWTLLVASLTLSVLLSYGFFLLFERPSLQRAACLGR